MAETGVERLMRKFREHLAAVEQRDIERHNATMALFEEMKARLSTPETGRGG
ncbi:hypothetical protein TomTYG75_07340 [Sphingobium sp. TomTYG75]